MSLSMVRRLASAAVLLAALGTATGASATTSVRIGTAPNPSLRKTILVNSGGHSLYSLSAETRGRFICTDRVCLSNWTPLLASHGARPVGVPGLGTIRRPNGGRQVTYHNHPLYTFNADKRAGQVRGEGFVDVGTWHAVVVGMK